MKNVPFVQKIMLKGELISSFLNLIVCCCCHKHPLTIFGLHGKCSSDALRVLPCQHEYHLHCFDRWVYTFATDSRPRTEPTCPLCKYTLS